MKKKYKVLHYSDEFVFGLWSPCYDTYQEAEKYVSDFQGNKYHKRDEVEIVEIKDSYDAVEIDKTEDGSIYGFKK